MAPKPKINMRSQAKCDILETAFVIPINVTYSRDREGKKHNRHLRLIHVDQKKKKKKGKEKVNCP